MSKVADSIRRGLEDAIRHATGDGDSSAYQVHIPEKAEVKARENRAPGTLPP